MNYVPGRAEMASDRARQRGPTARPSWARRAAAASDPQRLYETIMLNAYLYRACPPIELLAALPVGPPGTNRGRLSPR